MKKIKLPDDPFWIEGYNSNKDGIDITDCPYKEGTDGQYGWISGWRLSNQEIIEELD